MLDEEKDYSLSGELDERIAPQGRIPVEYGPVIDFDPKTVLFGEPVSMSRGGKDVIRKGLAHLLISKETDPRAKADSISKLWGLMAPVNKMGDFSPSQGLNAVRQFREQWQEQGEPPQAIPAPVAPPQMRQDIEPPKYISLNDERDPYMQTLGRQPEMPTGEWEGIPRAKRALLVGALIGSLLSKNKGKAISNVLGGFGSSEQKRLQEEYMRRIEASRIANRIAEMQLGLIDRKEEALNLNAKEAWKQQMARGDLEKQGKLGLLTRDEEKTWSEIRDPKGMTDPERKQEMKDGLIASIRSRANDMQAQGNLVAAGYLNAKAEEIERFSVDTGRNPKFEIDTYKRDSVMPQSLRESQEKIDNLRDLREYRKERLKDFDASRAQQARQFLQSLGFKDKQLDQMMKLRWALYGQREEHFADMMNYRWTGEEQDALNSLRQMAATGIEEARREADSLRTQIGKVRALSPISFLKEGNPETYAELTKRAAQWAAAEQKKDPKAKPDVLTYVSSQPEYKEAVNLQKQKLDELNAQLKEAEREMSEGIDASGLLTQKISEYSKAAKAKAGSHGMRGTIGGSRPESEFGSLDGAVFPGGTKPFSPLDLGIKKEGESGAFVDKAEFKYQEELGRIQNYYKKEIERIRKAGAPPQSLMKLQAEMYKKLSALRKKYGVTK